MSDDEPTQLSGPIEMRRLLQQLGEGSDAPLSRSVDQEHEREARMAERIDAELERLANLRRRTRTRWLSLVTAVAVAAVATWGMRHWRPGAANVAITQEPIAPRGLPPQAPLAPASAPAIAPRTLPSAQPRPLASALPSGSSSAAPSPSAAGGSTLGEENQLFKEAAEASRSGNVNGALTALDKLLKEHPSSPLAQTALVRKFRLLGKAGRSADARREASRYLAAYPTGFAVKEAQDLLQDSVGEARQ